MDDRRLDRFAQTLVGADKTRRAMLRLLAGGVLGSLTARLGSPESTAARHKKQRQRQRWPERKPSRTLQSEGARKKKGKGKKKPGPKPAPVPDPPCPDGKGLCPDGKTCVYIDDCCPGERRCNASDACIPFYVCCPDEKPCGEVDCIPKDQCCELDPPPLCNGACEAVVCDGGQLICESIAGDCSPGYEPDPDACEVCRCPSGATDCGFFCCPGSAPGCHTGSSLYHTYCVNAANQLSCPLGWRPYADVYCTPNPA